MHRQFKGPSGKPQRDSIKQPMTLTPDPHSEPTHRDSLFPPLRGRLPAAARDINGEQRLSRSLTTRSISELKMKFPPSLDRDVDFYHPVLKVTGPRAAADIRRDGEKPIRPDRESPQP